MCELYENPNEAGKQAFRDGKSIDDCPIDYRTHANARELWRLGHLSESTKCKGFEIEAGVYSGCNASAGDCPICGL